MEQGLDPRVQGLAGPWVAMEELVDADVDVDVGAGAHLFQWMGRVWVAALP